MNVITRLEYELAYYDSAVHRFNQYTTSIFQADALSPLLFIIAMMSLNHIIRKCTAGYKLRRSQGKINHLMYMDDFKLFAKNENELETQIHAVRIYSQDIGMEFGIEKFAMVESKVANDT